MVTIAYETSLFPLLTRVSLVTPTWLQTEASNSPVNFPVSHPQDIGSLNKKLSHTVSDLERLRSDFSFSIWTFRADLSCSTSTALSLLAAFDYKAEVLKQRMEEDDGFFSKRWSSEIAERRPGEDWNLGILGEFFGNGEESAFGLLNYIC